MTRRLLHPLVKQLTLDDYKHEHLFATTSALFDINEVWLALGEQTAPEYEPNMVTGPEPESTAEDLLRCVTDGQLTLDDLRSSYAVIDRYDNLLRRHGHSL